MQNNILSDAVNILGDDRIIDQFRLLFDFESDLTTDLYLFFL